MCQFLCYCRIFIAGMNYLAHIYLSGKDRRVQIGNFVGDAIKGSAYRNYPDGFRQGILLHRQIDAFSDSHPLVHEAVGMGRSVFGRYSAVVTDVFFDHFLALRFREYAGVSLKCFTSRFYMSLVWNYRYLPPRFQGFMWHFILTDRLGRYQSPEGIRQSLAMMARYRGLQVDSVEAIEFLTSNYQELNRLFGDFFPDLQEMCRKELGSQLLTTIS